MAERMKESGIQWIGAIPYNWNVERIKHIIQNNDNGIKVGPFGSALTNEVVSSNEGKYKVYGQSNLIRKDFSYGDNYVSEQNYKRLINYEVLPNDIAVSMMGTIGKCSVVPNNIEPGIMDSHLIKIRLSQKMLPRYFEYAYESDMGYSQLLINSKGSIMNGLNSTIVKGLYIPVPEIIEQQALVDFLDKECAQIDSIATDLDKQIALLQQYKKSLITETVTKGLDQSVPMKDSGVEWIGEIPDHWQKTRIKFEASTIGSGTTPDSGNSMYYDNGEHSWIQSGDLYGKDYIYETEKQLTTLAILECRALNWYTKDFVVVAMYGASVGNVAISKIDSFTNQACCVIKLNEENDNRYLFYFLKAAQEEMLLKAFGGTQPNISQVIIKNLNFLNVPLSEQIEISNFLDSKCDMIDKMLQSKKDQYDILFKHKKSLIYEYVTGKKRVKEVR